MLRNLLLGGTSPLALFAPEGVGGGGETVAPVTTQTDTGGPISLRDAANSFAARREKGSAEAEPEAEPKPEQPRDRGRFTRAQTESTPDTGGDAAADTDQPPGETEATDPVDEQPSIEPPRSWTKEDKEAFKLLPPERQQSIVERERTRDAEIRRGQDEVANERKAIEAERQATLQARQQYESAAQNALAVLQSQQAAEFADIKTDADVMKLATEDPFRFSQWQARQMQIQNQSREVQALHQQRQEQETERFKTWSKEQDDKFSKRFPEFNDPEKGPKLRASVTSYLTKEIGVPENVLPKLWNEPLFRDEMFQRIVYEASRFHVAQQTAKAAVQKPVPPVQRPGVASSKGERNTADIAVLTKNLDGAKTLTSQLHAAAALRAAKRVATR